MAQVSKRPAANRRTGSPATAHAITTAGRNEDPKQPPLDELWDRVLAAFDAALEAAREDPEAAKKLYAFALYGLGNREMSHGIREAFTDLQIPLDFLSHTKDRKPFA